jgi:predicted Zn-dependent protease
MLAAALASPLQLALAQVHGLPAYAAAPDTSSVRLPALGESAAADFDVSTERRLGEQIMGEIRRDPDYLDDAVLGDYLAALWQPLVAAARRRGDIDTDVGTQFAWESFLVRDRSVNAFALPGGFVGVHLGLIAMTATRDELASVLAHELTHITQRHIARGMASQSRQSVLGMAAMILALLAASRSNNPDMAQAAIVSAQAAMIQGQLNFSRDMEREADRIGFAVLNAAGYAPGGMVGMFEKLDGSSRLNDSGSYPYLRSHPLTFERQSEARLRLQGLPGQPAPGASTSSPWLHALMVARSRVLMDATAVSLRRLQDTPALRSGQGLAEQLAGLYTAALASSLLRDAISDGTPVIGHCLGGQLMAKALGARVARMPKPEIGWLHVDVCDRGARREWFGGLPRFAAFQWHYDAFDLPPMATRILTNDVAVNQGFVIDDRHVGFQCHIEMTHELVQTWCRSGADELPARSRAHQQSAFDIQSDLPGRLAALGEVADGVYARWAQKVPR